MQCFNALFGIHGVQLNQWHWLYLNHGQQQIYQTLLTGVSIYWPPCSFLETHDFKQIFIEYALECVVKYVCQKLTLLHLCISFS